MGRIAGNDRAAVELLYHPYQAAFLDALAKREPDGSRAFDRLALFAGRRGGKTRVGAIAAAREAARPKTIGWCCAPSYDKLHDYVMPAVLQTIPQQWIVPGKDGWSAEHRELRLVNGSVIRFRSLDDPDRGQGSSLDWLWIDEICELPQEAWTLTSPALVDREGVCWVTTTPHGEDWVYDTFWQVAQDGEPGYWACQYTTLANPFIKRDQVERQRRLLDPKTFARLYEASFVSFTGAVYSENITETHLLTSIADVQTRGGLPEWPGVDPTRTSLVPLDTGADHPFGALQIVVTQAGLVVIGEYRERDNSFRNHIQAIGKMLIPTQTRWAANRTERQLRLELAQHGVYAQAVDNDLEAGIQRVQSWLVTNRLFFVADRCPRLLKELKAYRYADNTKAKTGETKDRELVVKKNDDLCDCLRYAVMAWPQDPEPVTVTAPSVRDRNTVPLDAQPLWDKWMQSQVEADTESTQTNVCESPPLTLDAFVGSAFEDFYV